MRTSSFLLVFVGTVAVASARQTPVETDVLRRMAALETAGAFHKAEDLAVQALADGAGEDVAWARERLRRLRREFSLTRDGLVKAIADTLTEFDGDEFDRFDREGRFDKRRIDGQVFYMNASRSNLLFRHPDLESRRKVKRPDTFTATILEHVAAVMREAALTGERIVLPRAYDVTMTIDVAADAVPAGKTVRCWMPFPRAFPHQRPGELTSTEPPVLEVGAVDAPMRAVCLERPAEAGKGTTFAISYRYQASAVAPPNSVATDPGIVLAAEDRRRFTSETPPHVVFSPAIDAAIAAAAAGEKAPEKLARRFHDWIGENIKYSYCVEYSTTPNITEATLARRWGDCGEAALLFITMCRRVGVPARWQSGWAAWPGHETMHDWCEIFLEGRGWSPVDPYMSVHAQTRPEAERRVIRDFYFGGLDHWRLAANADHQGPLSPPKPSFRSDTVDFQRGEVECDGVNVYYDRFKYRMRITPVVP